MSSLPRRARGWAVRRGRALGLAAALAAHPALAGDPPTLASGGPVSDPSDAAAAGLAGAPPNAAPASAPPTSAPAGTLHALGVQGGWSNVDAGAGLSYRVRLPGGTQFGLDARYASLREGYISGYAVESGAALAGSAVAMIPWARFGPVDLDVRLSAGARALDADETRSPDRSSTALTTDFGPVVNVHAAPWLTLRTGWLNVVNLQLAPATDLDALGQIVLAGVAVPVGDRLLAHADFETGGLFGYDGDGGKYLTRVSVGLRWVLGESGGRPWTTF
ncbi:MAG TPA: hypothetical protein VFS43_03615 [Polyangiaceae bacterium]|nr:hypothetical protein [Polyangiaceae bacterium]